MNADFKVGLKNQCNNTAEIKGIVHPKMKILSNYSTSYCSNPIRLSLI